MQIKQVKIDTLQAHPKNPRVHPESAIEKIRASISEFGWTNPVLASTDGYVLAGHARLKAARESGIDTVPVIELPFEGMSAKGEAYLIADNKIQEFTDWDELKLGELVAELNELDYDVSLTGFDDAEVDEILAGMVEHPGDEDAVPDVVEDEPAVTQAGDLIEIGRHRLLCGDCTVKENVERLMGGKKADMVFTDPPYGINVVRNNSICGDKLFGKNGFDGVVKAGVYKPIKGDETTKTAQDAIRICLEVCNLCLFWGGNFYTDFLPPVRCWVVWDKETDGNFGDGEIAWCNADKSIRIFRHKWSGMLKASEHGDKRVHPTQKPIALAEWAFNEFTARQNVLDVFLGSGSTLIACEKTNRICYGMEIDPHYCDVIVRRYINYVGADNAQPELVSKYMV